MGPDQPVGTQTADKEAPARSQKSRELSPSRSAPIAAANGRAGRLKPPIASSVAPYGSSPRSCGRSRINQPTSGRSKAAPLPRPPAPPDASAVPRHDRGQGGEKDHLPRGRAGGQHPSTSPRRSANQRLTTVAPRTKRRHPGPHRQPPPPLEQNQLPGRGDLGGERHSSRDRGQRPEHRPPHTDPIHERGGEWTDQPAKAIS